MKTKTLFFLLFISIFLTSCGIKSPIFKGVSNIDVYNSTNENIILKGDIMFYNPNKMGLKIKETDLNVNIQNLNSINIHSSEEKKIEKESNFSIPIEVSIAKKDLVNNGIEGMISIFMSRKIDVTIEGYIKVKKGAVIRIPFKETKSFGLK